MNDRDTWDAAARSRVSERWAQCALLWNTAMTDALLSVAAISPDSVVLDLAAGSGDPALSIAKRLAGGTVIALDSSRTGLVQANNHAKQLGLSAKVKTVQADAHATPLKPNCVDRVTCRCGNHVLQPHRAGHVRGAACAQAGWTRCLSGLGFVRAAILRHHRCGCPSVGSRCSDADSGSHYVSIRLPRLSGKRTEGCWVLRCS